MHESKLGSLPDSEAHRDAIHVAIAPVVASHQLLPCQHVGIDDEGKATGAKPHVGIVDPFLSGVISAGQRFYLCLYPGSITSLRHDWTHPAFVPGQKEKALEAIKAFGSQVGLSYERLMEAAAGHLESGEYINCGEFEGYKDADWDSFWNAYGVVTAKPVPKEDRGWFFNCSC